MYQERGPLYPTKPGKYPYWVKNGVLAADGNKLRLVIIHCRDWNGVRPSVEILTEGSEGRKTRRDLERCATNVQMFGCPDVQMYGCTDVEML